MSEHEHQHQWIVDRRSDGWAVVEIDGRRTVELPDWLLPPDAGPDSVLAVRIRYPDGEHAEIRLALDAEAERRALSDAERTVDALRDKDPGGDLTL